MKGFHWVKDNRSRYRLQVPGLVWYGSGVCLRPCRMLGPYGLHRTP